MPDCVLRTGDRRTSPPATEATPPRSQLPLPRLRRLEARLRALKHQPPYDFRPVSSAVFRTALRQRRNARQVHCRSMDRLHLAAMEELALTRLMSHDDRQAKAAIQAGFEVVSPGLG